MHNDTLNRPGVCCVIGAGDATGSAVARRFAREGCTVCVARRTAAALQPLVERIRAEGGRAQAFGLDARREEQVVAFFDQVQAEVGPVEVVVFNVGGKAAPRALAQSMARELGPRGLHVAHVVIDGLIDTAFAREHFAQRVADAGPDGILNPEHIANAYWWLHQQPRDAWTFELDLRPSVERW